LSKQSELLAFGFTRLSRAEHGVRVDVEGWLRCTCSLHDQPRKGLRVG
jgi:hypothetical protein